MTRSNRVHISWLRHGISVLTALLLLVSCGKPITPENPIKREKINDGVNRKILLEDRFPWTQSFARITAYTPDGEQRFKVQVRSRQDSILWAAISDDMIGLRVGKCIVIKDSAAFTSTLLGLEWSGSASDLAGVTGIEVPFQYLNRILRGQLIGWDEALRYRFNADRDLWMSDYNLGPKRYVRAALDRDLHLAELIIQDPAEIAQIKYFEYDERTRYPRRIELTLVSRPEYKVVIDISDIRTEGPYNTPFSF
jgi:hypothetical protein